MNKDQFLFRGNRIDNGELVEGYVYKDFSKKVDAYFIIDINENLCGDEQVSSIMTDVHGGSVRQFTGLVDKSGIRIFADDIRIDHLGVKFRIYQTVGGFVVMQPIGVDQDNNLLANGTLVSLSLSDPRAAQYICESTVHFSNVWDEKLKTEKL